MVNTVPYPAVLRDPIIGKDDRYDVTIRYAFALRTMYDQAVISLARKDDGTKGVEFPVA